MGTGTFNVSRKIWHNPVFKVAKFSDREAFIWLVSEASWKPRTIRDKTYVISLERGQLTHSLRFMADIWGWKHDAVKRYLVRLENHDMIRVSNATGQNVITIYNYEVYQNEARDSATATATATATGARQERDKEEEGLNKGNNGNVKKDTKVSTKKPNPKHYIPDNWQPPSDGITYAIDQGIPERMVQDEISGFIGYWADRTDAGGKKSDRGWLQCWKTNCRRVGPQAKRNSQMANGSQAIRNGKNPSLAAIVAERRNTDMGGNTDRGEGQGVGQGDFIDGEFHAASD